MRIIFTDGTQKGIREENVTSSKIVTGNLVVNMKDGAVFTFPLYNVREVKEGGEQREPREPRKEGETKTE